MNNAYRSAADNLKRIAILKRLFNQRNLILNSETIEKFIMTILFDLL